MGSGQVVAGLEPEKTNAFLQLLAEAATSKKSPPSQQVMPTTSCFLKEGL